MKRSKVNLVVHYNNDVQYAFFQILKEIMRYLNYIFTAIFILEALIKLVALGFRRYFREK